MPALSTIHIDVALTNVSVMYRNDTYVADQVLPILPVQKRSDKYFVYKKEDFASPSATINAKPASLRRPGTEAAEVDYSVSTQSYFAEEYALRGLVQDAEVAIADDPLQPDIDQTIQLTERLMLDNEVMAAGKVGAHGSYNASNTETLTTGGTGTSWAQYASANSNPFTDIKNGRLAVIAGIMRDANTFFMDVTTARTLADHPLVKDLIKYTSTSALTASGLPPIIKGLTVLEAPAQKNTAVEGAAYSGANVWQDDVSTNKNMALVYYRNPQPTLKGVSFGYTFEAPDDATGVRGFSVRRWREDKRKGNMVECSFLRDFQFIAQDGSAKAIGGYLICGTCD